MGSSPCIASLLGKLAWISLLIPTALCQDSATTTATNNCQGYATYTNVQPVTVYVTVTEGYTVTMTQNGSMTASEIYVTPSSACGFTILTTNLMLPPAPSSSNTGGAVPTQAPTPPYANTTGMTWSVLASTTNGQQPGVISSVQGPNSPSSTPGFQLTIPMNNGIPPPTYTVTVTKKTPVGVQPTSRTSPVVQFPGGSASPNLPGASTPSPGNGGGGGGNTPPSTTPPPNNNNNVNNGGSPPAGTTSFGSASQTATLVNGVPVQVGGSSANIGGSNVALPQASSTTTVVVNGQTYTVAPTAVIGPSTTLSFARQQTVAPNQPQDFVVESSTITRNGVVITIGSTAVVIAGTTYGIGPGAHSTTVVVDGRTVTLDSAGVVFPSTTYSPASRTIVSPFQVTTVSGLVFSLDQSQAVFSGTTYGIGSGAFKTTVIVSGTTVVFGPSGVVIPSTTTLPPVSATKTSSANTKATGTALAASSTSKSQASATRRAVWGLDFMLSSLCAAIMSPLILLL